MTYPEERWVSGKTLILYAYDLWAGEADYHICHECWENVLHLDCEHASEWEPVHLDGSQPPTTAEEAIDFLADRGAVTVQRCG